MSSLGGSQGKQNQNAESAANAHNSHLDAVDTNKGGNQTIVTTYSRPDEQGVDISSN